jgi:hypothetical protein
MGQALGRLLRERGESIAAIASLSPERAALAAAFVGGAAQPATYADLPQHAARILIAVPDDAIGAVARLLANVGMRQGIALHTSGAHGPEALARWPPPASHAARCILCKRLRTPPKASAICRVWLSPSMARPRPLLGPGNWRPCSKACR